MIASGIALAFNRKAADVGKDPSASMPAPRAEPCKSELSALVDLPEHMDHWFRESSPRNEPILLTCAVPRPEARKPEMPSPSSSPSVLSSGQLRIWRAMSQAQEPGPAARSQHSLPQHSLPQQVPGKHAEGDSQRMMSREEDGEATASPALFTPPQLCSLSGTPDSCGSSLLQEEADNSPSSTGEWPASLRKNGAAHGDADVDFAPQSPFPHARGATCGIADVDFAPQSPFPHARGAPSRSYSEDEWSPSLDTRLSGAGSDTSSEAVFEMSKSGSECSVLGSEFGVGRSESAASLLDDCRALAQGVERQPMVGSPLKLPSKSFSVDDLASAHRAERKGPAEHDSQVEKLEAMMAALRAEMADKDRELLRTQAALTRKTQECENLTHVVRELTRSRCKAVGARTVLGEALAELQHEHTRMARITELSRTVSRENLARANAARLDQKRAEEDANAHRRATAALRNANSQLVKENDALRERMAMMSHRDPGNCGPAGGSACMRAFTSSWHLKETY